MVYKFKPLELSLDFDDREYDLGHTIDIKVNLAPAGDVGVREARVDLVCEELYSRNERGVVIPVVGGSGLIQGGNTFKTTDYVPASSWVNQRAESYVHSSVVFLEDRTLPSGKPSAHSARLQIQPQPPTHLDEARDLQRDAEASWTFKWRLVASVNVVRGRDQKRQRKVSLKLPLAPAGGRVGARPRMSKPKARTRQST